MPGIDLLLANRAMVVKPKAGWGVRQREFEKEKCERAETGRPLSGGESAWLLTKPPVRLVAATSRPPWVPALEKKTCRPRGNSLSLAAQQEALQSYVWSSAAATQDTIM